MRWLPGARLLPITVIVAAALLVLKCLSLGQAAFAEQTGSQPSIGHQMAEPARMAAPAAASPNATAPVAAGSPNRPPASADEPKSIDDASLAADGPDAAQETFSAQLRRRSSEIESRRVLLDAREAALQAATVALNKRMAELDALRAQLQSLQDKRKAADEQSWVGLVRIYEAMRPANAAAIFDLLDTRVLLQVLDRMNDRKAAVILADMVPERARLATQLLAQLRLKANADSKGGALLPG